MHVAITGASSGIGEALVREWARAGAHITLVARRRELLERLAHEVGVRTFVAEADLSHAERANDWIAAAEGELGPIDVLVNNAGMQIVAAVETIPRERWEAELRLDLLTPLRAIHAVLPGMIARRSGAIVNVVSAAAFSHLPGMAHYSAAKAGLAAASETMRAELRRSGVHVCTVYPGPVRTPLGEAGQASYPPSITKKLVMWGSSEVLAARVRRAVERRRARVVYPRLYHLVRWLPELIRPLTDWLTPPPKRLPAPAEGGRLDSGG